MPRSKRFTRDKNPPTVHLTDDDHAVIMYAARRRLITNQQLHSLFPNRSNQKLTRRVRDLFDVGLLDRPPAQVRLFRPGEGSNAIAVAVSDKGVAKAEQFFKVEIPGSGWSRRNQRIRAQSIEHILDTTQFMVSFETSVRKRSHIIMRDGFDVILASDEQRRKQSKPLSFTVPVKWHGRQSRRGIEPDELVSLTYSNKPAGKNIANFVVEIDRETETIEPGEKIQKDARFFRRSSILLKNVIYANAFREKSCQCFGFGTFRVLMVTTTPSHMARMQILEEKYLAPRPFGITPGFILYTNQQTIVDHGGDLLDIPWQTRTKKTVYLDGQ